MRVYPETLLEQTLVGAVRKHQEYCAAAAVPWGMSECAHAQPDHIGNYGYKAFGVPDLAISPNYSEGLVISPYSSFLALAIDPQRSIENLRSMVEAGWLGRFGFYESADYRVGTGSAESRYELVRCWMTHHQGMSMLACLNLLHDGIVQSWFHSDLRVRATEMLLQEKRIR
jgi:cyclic beta-1,2-glucan synthetase